MLHETVTESRAALGSLTPEQEQLARWVGRWKTEGLSYTEGESKATMRASRVRMSMAEEWEWLPGRHFLSHRWDGSVGEAFFQGLEVIGFDRERGRMISRFFDSNGNAPVYEVMVHEGNWTYSGKEQRATFTWEDDGNAVIVHWDWLNGGRWVPLCDLKSVRLR